jgi:hypothetical protein
MVSIFFSEASNFPCIIYLFYLFGIRKSNKANEKCSKYVVQGNIVRRNSEFCFLIIVYFGIFTFWRANVLPI